MTNRPEIDQAPILAGKTLPLSLLSSDDEQRAGIRVTRAEFAKMMECSRQAVTDWVQSGRIAVGAVDLVELFGDGSLASVGLHHGDAADLLIDQGQGA